MRQGTNPLKGRSDFKATAPITIALLNYIPFESGFFREGLSILKFCLASVRRNTALPHNVLVFDNGSAQPVIDFLLEQKQQGEIDFLILSEANVGKVGAWNVMLRAAPGDYIAYADGDVFFYPGWLEEHLRVLAAFPKAGMVTGLPMRHMVNRTTENTIALADQDADITQQRGDLIPLETRKFFCEGVGMDYDRYMGEYGALEDIKLSRQGVEAFVGASHFQFMVRKAVIDAVFPLSVSAPLHKTDDRQLDRAVDETGFMKLSVAKPCVQHLGNALTDEWQKTAHEYGVNEIATTNTPEATASWKQRLRNVPLIKRVLMKIYNDIFSLYYRD